MAKSDRLETSLNPMLSHMEITNHMEGHRVYHINMFMYMCYFPVLLLFNNLTSFGMRPL